MSRILLILAILLMSGAAFLGFKTRNAASDLKGKFDTASAQLTSTKVQLNQKENALKAAQDETAKVKAEVDAKDKELSETKSKLETETAKAKQMEETLAAKDKEIADLNLKLKPADPNAKPVDVPQLQEDLKKAQAEVQEKATLLEASTAKVKNLENELASTKSELTRLQTNRAKSGLEGTVMAVNQGFGFVVLDIGDKKGVAINTEMIVLRGAQRVGAVKVTSIEPNTSIADIIPGSVPRGEKIQPGDRVIFQRGAGM